MTCWVRVLFTVALDRSTASATADGRVADLTSALLLSVVVERGVILLVVAGRLTDWFLPGV